MTFSETLEIPLRGRYPFGEFKIQNSKFTNSEFAHYDCPIFNFELERSDTCPLSRDRVTW